METVEDARFGAVRGDALGRFPRPAWESFGTAERDVTAAYLNRIATGVPPHDVHATFVCYARELIQDRRQRALLDRMIDKAQIAHRYSVLARSAQDGNSLDVQGFYGGDRFPSTGERMRLFERHAPELAAATVQRLELGAAAARITHLVVTTCTGLYAPGLDLELLERLGLPRSVERTMVGFMGCYAAMNALKVARHIVRSEPAARVLVVNLEICSLHLQRPIGLEQVLSFLVFGDGCAASLVSAAPEGFALDHFQAIVVPDTADLITWRVGDLGFDMYLSGRVPAVIADALAQHAPAILGDASPSEIDLWAVHPGGRSVLDAVERGLGLGRDALAASRRVLEAFGNMSSATVMFVLASCLATSRRGQRGCAMAFGPGLTAETLLFSRA